MDTQDVIVETLIYYTFMLSDGEITKEESIKFDEICTALEISTDKKHDVMKFTANYSRNYRNNLSNLKRFIDQVLARKESGSLLESKEVVICSHEQKARIIWTLINLGYSDNEFTKLEKDFINYVVEFFDFNRSIYLDMIDSAETILMLNIHKNWIDNQSITQVQKTDKTRRIEENINRIYKNVQINIDEFKSL